MSFCERCGDYETPYLIRIWRNGDGRWYCPECLDELDAEETP